MFLIFLGTFFRTRLLYIFFLSSSLKNGSSASLISDSRIASERLRLDVGESPEFWPFAVIFVNGPSCFLFFLCLKRFNSGPTAVINASLLEKSSLSLSLLGECENYLGNEDFREFLSSMS